MHFLLLWKNQDKNRIPPRREFATKVTSFIILCYVIFSEIHSPTPWFVFKKNHLSHIEIRRFNCRPESNETMQISLESHEPTLATRICEYAGGAYLSFIPTARPHASPKSSIITRLLWINQVWNPCVIYCLLLVFYVRLPHATGLWVLTTLLP